MPTRYKAGPQMTFDQPHKLTVPLCSAQVYLPEWAWVLAERNEPRLLVDPRLGEERNEHAESIDRMTRVRDQCFTFLEPLHQPFCFISFPSPRLQDSIPPDRVFLVFQFQLSDSLFCEHNSILHKLTFVVHVRRLQRWCFSTAYHCRLEQGLQFIL